MAETVLPLRGGVILDGVQFPTDPGLYEPLAQPRRHSVHRTDGGGMTFQDGGVTIVDNRIRLGSGSNLGGDPQIIDTTAVRELHRRFRQFGATFTFTDWLLNSFTVFIAEFRPRIHRRDLWTYDMLLIVTAAQQVLPVGPFLLTVENGMGGGEYPPGTRVTITANSPPLGQQFLAWVGAVVASPTSPTTTLVMPMAKTFVEATYNTTGKFTLTVVSGTGSGDYRAGEAVTIVADDPPPGLNFDQWVGATVAVPRSRITTLVMPIADTTVTATYGTGPPGTFILTVVGGVGATGGGNYAPGSQVVIFCGEPPSGQAFSRWSGPAGPIGVDVENGVALITMPASDVTYTAVFVDFADLLSYFEIRNGPLGFGSSDDPWNLQADGPLPIFIGAKSGDGTPAPFFTGQVDLSVQAGAATLITLFDANMVALPDFRTTPFVSGGWEGFVVFNTDGVPTSISLRCDEVGGAHGGSSTTIYFVG